MYKKILLLSGIVSFNVYADCVFKFINNSSHPVTLRGILQDNESSPISTNNWLTVAGLGESQQVVTSKYSCNNTYHNTSELMSRVDLKNDSGYWVGNKGFLFASIRSYSTYTKNDPRAIADDGSPVSLSNGITITQNQFKVYICDDGVFSDECN